MSSAANTPTQIEQPSYGVRQLSAAELDALIAATTDAVLVLDADGRCVRIGPCASDPRTTPLYALVGRRLEEVLPPDAAYACRRVMAQALRDRKPQRVAFTFPVGEQAHSVAATLAPSADGTIVWIARDLTPRFEAAAEMARRERELGDMFEAAFDGMLVCAPDLTCLAVNGALCDMLGRGRPEILALSYAALVDPDDLAERPLRLPELERARRLVTERRLLRGDGTVVVAEVGTTLLEDGRVLFVIRDITERKSAEAAVESLALHDELTGLYNRRGFLRAAEREWARAAREGWDVVLFAFDLDDLKPINDEHGHAAGDAALVAVAEALRATFRHADVIARVGGDEFVAFIVPAGLSATAHPAPSSQLRVTGQIIRDRLAHHLGTAASGVLGSRTALGVSVGVAHTRPASGAQAGTALAALLATADAALYADKRARKDASLRSARRGDA